jgi:NADH:ubiquinone oxidoreductase subunit D
VPLRDTTSDRCSIFYIISHIFKLSIHFISVKDAFGGDAAAFPILTMEQVERYAMFARKRTEQRIRDLLTANGGNTANLPEELREHLERFMNFEEKFMET